ncbi:MAG: hypothetical protein HWE14_02470 [Flavobacteriia bacterium]|nr:hypothetical protein [Flavobacteriia bacterium]
MKLNISKITTLGLIAALVACTEEDPVQDNPTPTVEFSTLNPAEGAMYMLGDTVSIEGSIAYEPGLHGYSIELINMQMDSTVFYMDEHAHDGEIIFDEYWVNNVMHHSDMMLIVSAAINHEGDTETDTTHFHCHPM